MEEKSAFGVKGFILYNVFDHSYFFRVYDEEKNFEDYDLAAEDIQVVICDSSLVLSNGKLKYSRDRSLDQWYNSKKGNKMPTFVEVLRNEIQSALKLKDDVKKNVLRVALGEIDTLSSRQGSVSDDNCHNILRKLIENNKETMSLSSSEDQKKTLSLENEVLLTFLPKTLSVEEIKSNLTTVLNDIKVAKSDGQAVGVAMKYLKQMKLTVIGADVSKAVSELRT